MMESNNYTRRFETGPNVQWVKKEIDDLLYGIIRCLTTFDPYDANVNTNEYVTKRKLTQNIKLIYILHNDPQRITIEACSLKRLRKAYEVVKEASLHNKRKESHEHY